MQTFEIRLYGYPLKLKTDHNEETLEIFRNEIEETIKKVKKNHKHISLEKALFLTCLCLTEDKYLLKKAMNQNLDRLESQAKSVLKDLESSSKGINFKDETSS